MRSIFLTRGVALGGVLTLVCASTADAAGGSPSGGESTPLHLGTGSAIHAAASGGGSSVLRTIVALVVVIGIIYAVARILRAIKGRDAVKASGNGLEQVATLPLAPGRSVSLVRSGRDLVLLGVSEQSVSAIKTYTQAEAIASGIELRIEEEAAADQTERPMDRIIDGLRRLTVRS
jgi:flagellar biogenesis protein FliO